RAQDAVLGGRRSARLSHQSPGYEFVWARQNHSLQGCSSNAPGCRTLQTSCALRDPGAEGPSHSTHAGPGAQESTGHATRCQSSEVIAEWREICDRPRLSGMALLVYFEKGMDRRGLL